MELIAQYISFYQIEIHLSESKNFTSKPILYETNRRVEKWCEIGHFVLVKMTPICLVFSRAIISYVIYFTTHAGNDAFELPLLLW